MTQLDGCNYGAITNENKNEINQLENNHLTVRQTTFNLISLITGSGMLALPYAASTMGWSAVFVLLFLAILFLYCFGLLAEVIEYCIKKEIDEIHIDGGLCFNGESIMEMELSSNINGGISRSDTGYKVGTDTGYNLGTSDWKKQNSGNMMNIDFVTLGV